ncbi:hypothetical protein CSC81_17960, partial [Tenacibaculum discolor]
KKKKLKETTLGKQRQTKQNAQKIEHAKHRYIGHTNKKAQQRDKETHIITAGLTRNHVKLTPKNKQSRPRTRTSS